MKILFYLEPHPIRNRFESFGFIGTKILRMLRDEYLGKAASGHEPHEVRILLSRHYSKLVQEFPDMKPAILGMTKEENNAITDLMRDWDTEPQAIDDWVDLMKGEGAVSDVYMGVLDRVRADVFNFDLVVNWSTNGAIRKFCDKSGIPNISLEQGCVRDPIYNSLYVDAMGVNGMAISRHIDLDRIKPMNQEVLRLMLPTKGLHDQGIDAIHNPVRTKHAEAIYQGSGNNVLITLQLKDDSNCILYSQYGSMLEMLKEVVPQLTEAGFQCFIKPHPAAKDRAINQADHLECKEFVESFDEGVFWLDDLVHNRDYIPLLNKMDWIVTVNSSAGFEAMIYGRPVVILGDAPYKIGNNLPQLADLISGQFDLVRYQDTCARIVSAMVLHYLVPATLAFDFTHLMGYLERAIKTRHIFEEDGAAAMTDFMARRDHLDFAIRARLTEARTVNSYYAKYRPAAKAAPVQPVVVRSAPSGAVIQPAALPLSVATHDGKKTLSPEELAAQQAQKKRLLSRKLTKLRRDPAKFMVDSKNPVLRSIGLLMGGRP